MSTNPPVSDTQYVKQFPVIEFSKTEQNLMERLGDGQPHLSETLLDCLWDDRGTPEQRKSNLQNAITRLRKKIVKWNQGILVQFIGGKVHYRRVIFFLPPSAEKPARQSI